MAEFLAYNLLLEKKEKKKIKQLIFFITGIQINGLLLHR